jgi:NADH-quinone oxidoreductase subunit J
MGTAALDNAVRQAADYSNTEALGEVLYTEYVLAFEIAAVILLVAIVAAITLTLRRRPTTKYQTPGKQIKVKRDDRLKIIKSDAEVLK